MNLMPALAKNTCSPMLQTLFYQNWMWMVNSTYCSHLNLMKMVFRISKGRRLSKVNQFRSLCHSTLLHWADTLILSWSTSRMLQVHILDYITARFNFSTSGLSLIRPFSVSITVTWWDTSLESPILSTTTSQHLMGSRLRPAAVIWDLSQQAW